ncbi:MAG: tape measure protein, partial [Sphaerospermopsis kisseleviana]
MNLGELIVELSADTAELEKSLEQAKKKAYEAANSIEKIFGNINLEVNVDDDSLVDLNKHLNLKVNHLKEVNKYFNNNPITVQVDDDSLVDLNKHLNLKVNHLKEVNNYFNSNPIVVHTDTTKLDELEERLGKLTGNKYSIDVQQNIDVKVSDSSKHEITQIISDAIEDAFTSAVDKAVSKIDSAVSTSTSKSAGSNQNDESSSGLKEVIEELKSGFKAVNDSTGNKQLDEAISIVLKPGKDLITGFFEGISTGFGLEISKGMQDSLKKNSNIKMDEFGEKAADGFLKAFGVKIKSKKGKKSEVQSFGEEIVKDAIKSVSSGSLENIIQTGIGIAFDAAKRYSNTSGSQRSTQQNNNESTVTPEILTPLDPIPLPQASRRNRRRTRVLPPGIFVPTLATELVPQQANRSAVDSHDLMSPFEKAQEQSKDFSYSLEDVVKSKFTGSNLKNLTEKIIKIKTSHQSLHKTLQKLMEKARTSGDFRAIESIYLGYQTDGKKAINEIDRLIAEMRAGGATQEQINTLSRAKSPISRATGKSSKLSQLYQKSKREAEKAETVEFVGDAAVGIGLDTIAGLREGLGKGQFTKLAIENALAYLFAIKKTFGIASPSEVMKGIGLNVGEGFKNGAVASLMLANKRIAELIQNTINESNTATDKQRVAAQHFSNVVSKATATHVPLSTPVQQPSNADANQTAIVIKNQVKTSSGKGFDFKSIFNIFKNFDFGAIASNLIQSFLKRFSEGKGLFSKVISAFSGIITLVKKVFGIASPSKVMQEIGLDFGAGFEKGAIASLTLANKRIAEKLRDTVYNDPNATMTQKQAVDAQVARVTAQLNRIAQAYKSGQLTDNDAIASLGKVTRGNIRVGQYVGVGQRELSQEFKDSRQYVASRSKNVFRELFDSFLYSAKQSSQTGDYRLGDYLKNFAITFVEDFLKKQKVTGSKGGAFKDILSAAFGGNKPAFIGTLLKGFFGAGLFATFAERITNIIPDIIGSAIKNRSIGSILKTSLPLFASAAGLAASQAGGFVSNAITNNNAIKPGLINDLINSLTGVNLAKPTQKLSETLQTVFRTLTTSSFLARNQIPILKPLGMAATLINTLLSGKQLIDNTTVTSSGKPRTSVNEVVRNQIATNISSLGINSGEGIRGLVTQVTKTIVDSLTFKNMNLSPQLRGVVEKNKGIIDGIVNGAVSGILNLGIFTNKQSGILGKIVGAADAYGSGNVQGAISKGTAAVKGVTQVIGLKVDTSQIKIAMTALLLGISAFHKAFTEEGLNIGKALIKGFKEAQSNWISARNDVRRGIQRAIGAESLKDTLNDIQHEWGKGVVSASRFKELFDVMGSTFRKRMSPSMSPNDREGMQGNILSFIASISTAFAPITTLATSLIPLFAPLLPLFGAIGGAALMLGKHIQGVVNSIKEIEPLQRRLEFLGGSKEGGRQEMAYALRTANRLNAPVREGVQAYSQLAIAARNTKLEGDGVRELYEGISASLSALGIGGQDAGLVFMAYTQILAKGKVSMEELRQQLGEKFPPAMGVFAKALGVSLPELSSLISRGALLSEDVLPKVTKVLQQDYGNAASGAQGLTVAL